MSDANRIGPLVTMRALRAAYIALLKDYLPVYIADACRSEGLDPAYVATPRSWRAANELTKWPEDQLPAVIVVAPGLTGTPQKLGTGEYIGTWGVNVAGVVHGVDDDDTELQASVYGAAIRACMVKEGAKLSGLTCEGVAYEDEAYDALPQRDTRSLLAASVTCTVRMRQHVTGNTAFPQGPPPNPIGDPGPYPAAITVDVRKGH